MPNSLHDFLSLLAVGLCLVAVLHPRLPTGVLGTAGLGSIMVGVLYSIDDLADPAAALDIVVGGIAITATCIVWRVTRRQKRGQMRRVADWAHSSADGPETLPPELRNAIRGGSRDHG